MKAILVPTGQKARVIDIEDNLDTYHDVLSCDTITCTYPFSGPICLVIDDNGKISGQKKPNRNLESGYGRISDVIFGDFLVVGIDADEFTDVPPWLISPLLDYYNHHNVVPDIEVVNEVLSRPLASLKAFASAEEMFEYYFGELPEADDDLPF